MCAVKSTFEPNISAPPEYIFSVRIKLKDIAKEMGCFDEICGIIDECSRALRENNYQTEIYNKCSADRKGNILNATNNYILIMQTDPVYAGLRTNEMSGRFETQNSDGTIRLWTDADESASRAYIEQEYGIHSVQKHGDALACVFKARSYHPVKQAIESIKWDGTDRISMILSKWMGVEDSEYTREVSRLIFAGGIHRLYNPGCKFEDMPVLVGGQGAGKSSFVRFLAIKDSFFTELTTIDGKEGSEGVEGAWIVEVSELLALTKTKEQEAVKAYLSRLIDKYRPAYGKYVVERPRTCAFIGTTNREQFITDKTGGRRFYPVRCANTGYDLFDHEAECREYIRQCWAEALHKMYTPFMNPYATRSIRPQIEQAQELAMEEDYRVGMIQNWLDKHAPEKVCGGMIWEGALQQELSRFTKADQSQVGLIMNNSVVGWKRCKPGQMRTFERYGRQRFWVRSEEVVQQTAPEPNDFTPF